MARQVNRMDEDLQHSIRERAFALWEADGRPEGREMEYWLRAEQEFAGQPAAGEEQPRAALEEEGQLRRSAQEAVPAAEQLPAGADENPLSGQVRKARTEPKPDVGSSTLQGGDKVER
jgi:hypothetical protein